MRVLFGPKIRIFGLDWRPRDFEFRKRNNQRRNQEHIFFTWEKFQKSFEHKTYIKLLGIIKKILSKSFRC